MKRLLTVLGVATAMVVPASFLTTTTATAAPATAANSPSGHRDRADLTIVTDAAGNDHVTGRLRAHAGQFVFHFRSENAQGSDVALYRPRHSGVTLAQVVQHIRAQGIETPTPAALQAAAASTVWLDANIGLYGGGSIQGRGDARVSQTLRRGTYSLLDINKLFSGGSLTDILLARLRVVGQLRDLNVGAYTGTVKMVYEHGKDLFERSGNLDADAGIRITNRGDTFHFVVFNPVKPGTTDADMTALFNGFLNGTPPMSDPTDHSRVAVQEGVISRGRTVVFSSHTLKPGLYDLECYIADEMTGLPHAFMGMHKIVTVTP